MGLRIQNNVEAFNAHRQLTATATAAAKSMEKLSSGYRINRAADDAAGLAICEKMRGQIGGLAQAQRNAQDGVSLVQTAEGSLNEVHSMLQRVRDLKVQYKNGTLSTDDKAAIAAEVDQLAAEIKRHRQPAPSSTASSCSTAAATITFQVGANDGETITVSAIDSTAARRRNVIGDGLDGRSASAARHLRRSTPRSRTSSTIRARLRRGPEPPRAPPEQPRDLPGEPDRVREPDPRRGHGLGDGQVHEAQHPAAGRHEHARAGQPGPAGRPVAAARLGSGYTPGPLREGPDRRSAGGPRAARDR